MQNFIVATLFVLLSLSSVHADTLVSSAELFSVTDESSVVDTTVFAETTIEPEELQVVAVVDSARVDTSLKASDSHAQSLGAQTKPNRKSINFTLGRIRSVIPDGFFPRLHSWLWRRFLQLIVLVVSSCVIVLTVLFFRRKHEQLRFLTTTRLSVMDKEVQRACRYIEHHYEDPLLSPAEVCTELVTGEAFLEALFERELGMSIMGFVDQVRVNRAKHLFATDPSISIIQVAKLIGYADSDALERVFKKISSTDLSSYRA